MSTEAGKRLYRAVHEAGESWPETAPEWDDAIAAIEAQAAAAALQAARERIEGLRDPTSHRDIIEEPLLSRAAVLAALEEPRDA